MDFCADIWTFGYNVRYIKQQKLAHNSNFHGNLCKLKARLAIKTMLIQFTVENFRSIRDPQTLTMSASRAIRRLSESNTFNTGRAERELPSLLRSVAIYGANASGKSNLIRALRVMEQMVMHSAKADTDEPIDVQPFKLDKQFLKADTKFSIDFIESGIRFNYGYSCNPIRITREWLIAYPKSRPQVYFERNHDPENQKDEYAFGAKLQGGRLRHDWARQTGRNTLYLSRAVQQSAEDLQQLKVPFNWFSKRLRIMDAGAMGFSVPGSVTLKKCAGEEKAKIIDFVSAADIPISDIKVEMKKWDSNSFPHDMPANIKAGLSEIMNGKDVPEIAFYHRDSDGDLVEFAESEESGGTRSLFSFAGPWTDVIDKDRVLVIDELDTSLHPMVVHKLISMLHETTSRAQVIFTTHDTSIMSSRLLRRDQYYFVERDASGATHLKSLLEYKGREEDPIEKQYLAGVLGGTPILRGLKHVR